MSETNSAAATEWTLPEGFFEDNPMDDTITEGDLQYFQMMILDDTELHDKMNGFVMPSFDKKRMDAIEAEKSAIEALSTPEEVVRFMKKEIDPTNRTLLCQKAISMGDDTTSLIIERLHRIGIDVFIESAMLILSRAEEKHIDRVAECFREFRNKYSRASATVLLAYRCRKDALESIYKEYCDFSRKLDEEHQRMAQTILYSIYVLADNLKDKGERIRI